MHFWKKYTSAQINKKIDAALKETIDFENKKLLGFPVSKLDPNVFFNNIAFLGEAPLLRSYIANPNNIGCHTYGDSEAAFKGAQDLEKEVIDVLASDIFKAEPHTYDGYIATGGTEANIQALWIYRNLFMEELGAKSDEIVILSSEDTHYSIPKGSNLLQVDSVKIPVDFDTRIIIESDLENIIIQQKEKGKKYFIIVSNMATTMFGSVDNPDVYAKYLKAHNCEFKIHIDGAFGGFIYPFSNANSNSNFANQNVSSITIDAHKMLQAPYGTGVFLCRKGLIKNTLTKEAKYVEGLDLTLVGSRSGANAIAVWLILFKYGPNGWFEKINTLLLRTNWLCKQLDLKGIQYFRDPFMNIVTIKSKYISEATAHKFGLVPASHDDSNQWQKIVVMDHVEIDDLEPFISELPSFKN